MSRLPEKLNVVLPVQVLTKKGSIFYKSEESVVLELVLAIAVSNVSL